MWVVRCTEHVVRIQWYDHQRQELLHSGDMQTLTLTEDVKVWEVKLTCIIEERQERDAGSDLSNDGLNLSCDLLV